MAVGVQISSFVYVGTPVLNAVFGYYQAPASVQIQQLQITAQISPAGGSIIVALVNGNGTEVGRVTLVAGTSYNTSALTAFITMNVGGILRAKFVGVDAGVASDIVVNLIGATSQGPSGPSSCGPGGNECQPPTAQMLFFPGTQGPAGPPGPTGPGSTVPGPAGIAGPIGVYTGDYISTTVYFDNIYRKDIVSYAGSFWRTNNPSKNGTATWEAPTVSNWVNIGDTLQNIATGLKLLSNQQIPVGFTFIAPGFLNSGNFVDGSAGWLFTAAGGLAAYDAIINGLVSTGTPKFNLADVNRTMPTIGIATYDLVPIADVDIPVFPDYVYQTNDSMIMYGWLEGTNSYIENRFGNPTQKFQVAIQGIGTNTSGSADSILATLFYRTRLNGGSWGSWTAVSGQISYMQDLAAVTQSFANASALSVVLAGNQDIQFGAGFSKTASGTGSIDGATISALAFN